MQLTFTEMHTPTVGLQIQVDRQLYTEQSDFQRIDVFECEEFGRFLTLDGYMMLTERDEFIYHEMMVHVPLAVLGEKICKNLFQKQIHNLICRSHFLLMGTRFAVNTDSNLHLIFRQLKSWFSCCRNRTRSNSRSHRPHIVNYPLSDCLNLIQISSCLCQGPCNLVNKYSSCHSSSANGI